MAKKVNTSKTISEAAKPTAAELDKQIKEAAKRLGEEKKVKVLIPAYLKKRLGATQPVGINGAVIHVPVGEEVAIPESMAKVLNESLNQLKL